MKKVKPSQTNKTDFPEIPPPKQLDFEKTFNIVITSVRGTDVITIGALLGMAAHLEQKG